MKVWLQLTLSLIVAALIGLFWYLFFPGAPDLLKKHGIDIALISGNAEAKTNGDAKAGGPQGGGGGGFAARFGSRASNVEVATATTSVINDKVTALGTGIARNSVSVTPSASGTLTEIDVKSGAHVSAGEVIARMDSRAEQIARDKAALALSDAEQTRARYDKLSTGNTVTAVQLQAADLAVKTAELNLRNAELDLDNRQIIAPIAGTIGILFYSVGDAVTTQTSFVTIVDRSAILIDFAMPSSLVDTVKVGDPVETVPVARPALKVTGKVTAISNAIDAESGTFSVRAEVPNPKDSLRGGMAFTVTMNFAGDTYVAVDPLSIQWGSDGAYVWRVEAKKVHKVAVRIIQRNTGAVLVAGDVKKGDEIVTEGLSGLRPGAEVSVIAANGQPVASEKAPSPGQPGKDGGTPAKPGAPASPAAGS